MAAARKVPPRRAGRAGLSLVELLIALAITSLITAAVAVMLLSVSTGSSNASQTRGLMVGHAAVAARLGSQIRASRMVLDAGETYLVLWAPGTSMSGAPSLSQLCRIEYDGAREELHCYKAPSDLPPGEDTQYDLSTTDFNAVTKALRGTAAFPKHLWAANVAKWQVHLDSAQPRQARLVGYRLALTSEGVSETAAGAAALRN